ncbi:hypothetical protein F5Y15DRAFT_192211 [Xylariaceae sp. FL0016]|nr:hypothetical protein F5Y15DRAFT_192211 [Xylariaceae sp. FL0016]
METRSVFFAFLALAARTQALGPFGGYGNNNGNGGPWDGNNNPYDSSDDGSSGFSLSQASFANGFDIDAATRIRNIHGILGALAFAFLFPLGSIFMRLIPGRLAWIVHALTQIFAYIIYVAAAGLGLYLVSMVRMPADGGSLMSNPKTNAHPIVGIVLLVALFIQPFLGVLHHARFKKLGCRTAVSHVHLWLGRLGITLGIINGGLGLQLSLAPSRAVAAYSVVAAIMWLLWLLSAILGEVRRSRARRASEKIDEEGHEMGVTGAAAGGHHDAAPAHYGPSPPYTPGPLYGGPPVDHGHFAPRGQNAKQDLDRSDTVSSLSSYTTHRGQV